MYDDFCHFFHGNAPKHVREILLRRRRNLRRVPTTEEKPEVPISRDVKGISELDSGPSSEGFCERLQRLECLKTGSSLPRDRLKFVCLSDVSWILRLETRKTTFCTKNSPFW